MESKWRVYGHPSKQDGHPISSKFLQKSKESVYASTPVDVVPFRGQGYSVHPPVAKSILKPMGTPFFNTDLGGVPSAFQKSGRGDGACPSSYVGCVVNYVHALKKACQADFRKDYRFGNGALYNHCRPLHFPFLPTTLQVLKC